MNTEEILESRWQALAGPPEYIRITAVKEPDGRLIRNEIARIYRTDSTTRAEAIADKIINDHNTIIGILEAARRTK